MFNRGWVATLLAVFMSVVGAASGATAQVGSTQIDLNQYRPAELATDGFALSTADGQGHKRFGIMIVMDYNDDALVFEQVASGTSASVVHRQLTGHIMWNLGVFERLVIFGDIAYHFIIDEGQGAQAGLPPGGQFDYLLPGGAEFGDVYVGARGVLYGNRDDAFELALQATMTINTSSLANDQQRYAGQVDKSPFLGGWFELLMTFNAGDVVRIPIQAGYKLGTQGQVVAPNLFVGNEFTFGGGFLFMIAQDQFMISAEAFGRTAANSTVAFWTREETPVEVLGGFKYLHPKGFVVGVSGSGGVTAGYGAPDWRGIGLIGYTMPPPEVIGDSDGDGLLDDVDQCPNDAEDFDGFQDEDGCPDLDNDGDGVPDRVDNCPDEPGTVENHGCQDAQLVVIGAGQLEILEKVYFKTGSHKLQKRSFALLDNVAEVMNSHPEIEIIRVEGHSDATGSLKFNMRLSKQRANTVVRYLVGRGKVTRERLISEGFGPTRPLVPDATTKEERAQNRRVEFHIVDTGPEDAATETQEDPPGEAQEGAPAE
jgi:outer membrane protein OmpA-like peptidoglycan-associated protein